MEIIASQEREFRAQIAELNLNAEQALKELTDQEVKFSSLKQVAEQNDDKIADLKLENVALKESATATAARLDRDLLERDRRVAELSKELFVVRRSSSWRATAPFRAMANWFSVQTSRAGDSAKGTI